MRGGTENVPYIVALGRAARLCHGIVPDNRLRDALHDELTRALPGRVHLNGHPTLRLPNTLNVSIDGTTAQAVLAGAPGIAASAGSACHEGHTTPSPVLTAMGLPTERALSALRLTVGRSTTTEDISRAAAEIVTSVRARTGRCG